MMPISGDEPVCWSFQPNIFDSSRCHECLRLRRLHPAPPPATFSHTPEQVHPVAESNGRGEKEPSDKLCDCLLEEDCDDASVQSRESVCVLSPECDLYECDEDHLSESHCEGDSSPTWSLTPDEEEEEDFVTLPPGRMTRLGPHHSASLWTEEGRNREGYGRRSSVPHVGPKVDQDRDSGYFSLSRVTGSRTLRDKSPPAPRRHAERGHPLPNNRELEPKAAIPFRNPDLGVPSQRRNYEIQNPDLVPYSPEPVDLSIEVEAQAGPRSLSPTPFKQAESLATSKKQGIRTSYSSSCQQPIFSSKQNSGFSRSSSPSRSLSPFKRSESVSSLTSYGYGSAMVPEKRDQRSKSPNRNAYGRPPESESALKSFRTFASTVSNIRAVAKPAASPYAEMKASLRKAEPASSPGTFNKSISPSRRSQDLARQSLPRKNETKVTLKSQSKDKSRSPSPARRGGQSFLRQAFEGWRSASPVRKGYGAASHEEGNRVSNGPIRKNTSPSPVRRTFETRPVRKPDPEKQSSTSRGGGYASSQHKTGSSRSPNGRGASPSKKGVDPPNRPLPTALGGYGRYESGRGRTVAHQPKASHRGEAGGGSTLSFRSPAASRNLSPSRKCEGNKTASVHKATRVSWSTSRRETGRDYQSPSPRDRSPSPQAASHLSSQSSTDSYTSSASSGSSREGYAIVADLPGVKGLLQRVGPNQSEGAGKGNSDETSLYKPASHSHSKPAHITWDDMMERGNTSTYGPPHTQGNRKETEKKERVHKPDLLNFKKGWMSKQDDTGEWKKHWFVLTDAGLKYYRDSVAEEKDELDGEIDLRLCVKVSEFNVEKNYGFQIQTVNDVFTLSAMTAGIRRNWIEVLRKNIRPSISPDLTHPADSQRRPAQRLASQSAPAPSPGPAPRKFDCVELSPVATPTPPAPASQREAGEGQDPDEGVRGGRKRLQQEIEEKWEEFERLPLRPTASLPALGAWPTLRREQVAPLRLRPERCGVLCGVQCVCEGGGVCGCSSESLEQMERAHRQAMEELRRRYERQAEELRRDSQRLLSEEVQATAHAMEALMKAHKAELERAKTLADQTSDTHSLTDQHQRELLSLRRELDGLSEQYSQKCVELKREQQKNREKELQVGLKEEEVQQLSKEKLDLQSQVTEEIRRVRSFISGQKPEEKIRAEEDQGRASDLQVLLRVKQNEVDYLHQEIMCLRNEIHFLSTEKQSVCKRYNEVCEELKVMKDRSEREVQTLQEHLKLAVAALQEQQVLHNSI